MSRAPDDVKHYAMRLNGLALCIVHEVHGLAGAMQRINEAAYITEVNYYGPRVVTGGAA